MIKPLVSLDPALVIETIPSFDQMLGSNPAPYPYEKEFDDAENEPILVLHSSGSTGKASEPIPLNLANAAICRASQTDRHDPWFFCGDG